MTVAAATSTREKEKGKWEYSSTTVSKQRLQELEGKGHLKSTLNFSKG